MQYIKKQWRACLLVFGILPVLLAGCATHLPPDVGVVVVAPEVKLPAPPVIVQQKQPKPVGYFQSELLNYFSGSPVRPTTSMPPMPAAGQTPTQ